LLTSSELADRVGPTLSDGTRLRELIDFDRREVSMRVLHDPEIYRLELRRIYARSWVGVGHESEIPEVGDFVLRSIGEDPVIVTRTREGEIAILLNVCAHRGMEVCWADAGNQSQFKCPYHGWVFDNSGKLLGAPFEQEMYGEWDKSEYGLRGAKVAVRQGLIFGNFHRDPPPLEEYLGGLTWYIDQLYGGTEWKPWYTSSRLRIESNWKMIADQLSGDLYHGHTAHKAMAEIGVMPAVTEHFHRVQAAFHGGHSVGAVTLPFLPQSPDDVLAGKSVAFFAFPATGGANAPQATMASPADAPIRAVLLRHVAPRGPDRFEFSGVGLIEKHATDDLVNTLRTSTQLYDQIAGIDDFEAWPSQYRAASGAVGQEQPLCYNARENTEFTESRGRDDWPAPADIINFWYGADDSQWNLWKNWYRAMTEEDPS
jgi:nitrite reductase/ring-hydroxylating ferredoxin subunit